MCAQTVDISSGVEIVVHVYSPFSAFGRRGGSVDSVESEEDVVLLILRLDSSSEEEEEKEA